jgi:putative transcriptional regulator
VENANFTNHFLIAMPAMEDDNFARSLIYVAEHNEDGALGIIINRPLDLSVKDLLERVEIPPKAEAGFESCSVFFGGPVQTDRGFVLHRPLGDWQSSLQVTPDIALTSSKDILQALAENGQPKDVLISLGYAGWGAGQLEEELAQNGWLTVQADPRIIFDVEADDRLDAAIHLLGIDFANLSDVAGHA